MQYGNLCDETNTKKLSGDREQDMTTTKQTTTCCRLQFEITAAESGPTNHSHGEHTRRRRCNPRADVELNLTHKHIMRLPMLRCALQTESKVLGTPRGCLQLILLESINVYTRHASNHLFQLLLRAELVGPAAFLLTAVGGLDGQTGVAPTDGKVQGENMINVDDAAKGVMGLHSPTKAVAGTAQTTRHHEFRLTCGRSSCRSCTCGQAQRGWGR